MRDDRFDEVAGEQVARVFTEDFQAAKGLQAADMLNRAAENQLVAGADAHLRPHRRDEVIVALNFHQIEVVKPLQAALSDAFAGNVRLRQHLDGKKISVFDVLAAVAVRGQHAHPPIQHDQTDKRDRNADRAELEHAQRRQTGAFDERIDDKVGGRADQRGDAAQDGSVRKRNQQARRRDFLLTGEGSEKRGDDGGVVHESREQRADAGQADEGVLFVADEDFVGEAVQQRRALNHRRYQQKHHQRRQRRIAEAGEKRLGADDATKHEGGRDGKKSDGRGNATAGEREQKQRQGEQYDPVHGFSSLGVGGSS